MRSVCIARFYEVIKEQNSFMLFLVGVKVLTLLKQLNLMKNINYQTLDIPQQQDVFLKVMD